MDQQNPGFCLYRNFIAEIVSIRIDEFGSERGSKGSLVGDSAASVLLFLVKKGKRRRENFDRGNARESGGIRT